MWKLGATTDNARFIRERARALTPEERAGLKYWAEKYVGNGAFCLKHDLNVGAPLPT